MHTGNAVLHNSLLALELTQAYCSFVLFSPTPSIVFLLRKEMCDTPVGTTCWSLAVKWNGSKKLTYRGAKGVTSHPDGSSQLETRCRSESQRNTEGLGPSVTHGWVTPAKMRKKRCYGRGRTWVQITVCLRLQLISHTQLHHSFENKVWDIYFHKEVYSFIGVRKLCLIKSLFIFVLRLYNNMMSKTFRQFFFPRRI